jgi:N-acetylmuramoyl-L-alanine amidase
VRIIIISRGKVWLFWGGLSLLLIGSFIFLTLLHDGWEVQGGLNELKVLIDPGHGGVDGGTHDNQGNLEKQVNLYIALRLREHLRQSGLDVILTRETDIDLAPFSIFKRGRHQRDLMARIGKARDNHCLFLISIHCDWSRNPEQQGAKVFYDHQSATGRRLAAVIQTELNTLQQMNRKEAPGDFFIIKQRGVTGVIVEAGLLSNLQEAEMLQSSSYQEQLALAIAKGILKFCRNYLSAEPSAFNNIFNLEMIEE